jgi:hypothetical protein
MEPGMAVAPQTTLETVADYISDARTLLLDNISPYRYDDDSLIVALNVTLLEARRVRPDLFVFCGPKVQHFTSDDIEAKTIVKMEEQFRLAILHGLVGHALERDQEDVQDQRATAFLTIMSNILIGKGIVMPTAQPTQGSSK